MKISTRRRPAWAVSLLALICVCATAALPGAVAERGPLQRARAAVLPATSEARVIVKFKAESTLMRALSANTGAVAPPQHAQALSARLGVSLTDGRAIGARAQVVKAAGMGSAELAERLAAQSDVEYAVVDERKYAMAAPNDSLYGVQTTATPAAGQWYLRAPNSSAIVNATSVLSAINAEAAWNITTGSSSVVVAVLDTGVRRDHPDLQAKLLAGYDFVDASISNDGDGRDGDASDPGDFSGTGSNSTSSWHGTQTAGLIGASTNNGIGMASVGRGVMLLPVRVLGTGGGFDSDIQAAMLWAGGLSASPVANPNPAKVLNMSLGSTGACSASYTDVVSQLNNAGVVVVAAAGNDGVKVGTPANCVGVIAVAGVRHAGTKVGYSDLGPEIALAAPAGNCVNATGACLFPLLTTSNSGKTTPVSDADGGSIYTDGNGNPSLGTSFSAPLVSGAVGLMLSANPSLTPAQILSYLKSSARAFPATGAGAGVSACTAPTATAQGTECYCTTTTCGAGMLDANAAVARAAQGVAVANIGTLTTVPVGTGLVLSGALSTPSSASSAIQTYAWTIAPGSSIASFSSATNASSATLIASAAGPVTVRLTVTDNAGKTATASTTVTVVTPTSADIMASADSVVVGTPINLDGSASHASLGSVVSYQWSVSSGSASATLSGAANTATTSLATAGAGNVTVSLTVTDILGKTVTATKNLVVTPVPSSGGGAIELSELLGLLAALLGVWAVGRRRAG